MYFHINIHDCARIFINKTAIIFLSFLDLFRCSLFVIILASFFSAVKYSTRHGTEKIKVYMKHAYNFNASIGLNVIVWLIAVYKLNIAFHAEWTNEIDYFQCSRQALCCFPFRLLRLLRPLHVMPIIMQVSDLKTNRWKAKTFSFVTTVKNIIFILHICTLHHSITIHFFFSFLKSCTSARHLTWE